jgi:hypothetical protein
MLILAALSGIQDFLFDVRESGGGQARSLRNRSFRIQLIAECVALRLLEAAKLPYPRLLFSAAGKVCIDAEGLSADAGAAVRTAAADIQRRLLRETHGRLRLSIASEQSAGSFADQFERANHALAASKLKPFALSTGDAAGTWGDSALVVPQVWDADADSLGKAVSETLRQATTDRAAPLRRLSDALDRFFAETLEAVAQVRLREKYGIPDTKAVSLAQLPDRLRTEWANRGRDARSFMLGLQDAYRVLNEYGDEMGRRFVELGLAAEQRSPLVARNQSILAHGFQPVGQNVYNQLNQMLRELASLAEGDSQAWRLPAPR